MQFEYDPNKSASNRDKHGIDFEDAKSLWRDPNRVEYDALTKAEPRFVTVGRIGDRLWTAVFTMRAERIRLISVRRGRDEESEWYEENLSS